MGEIKNEAGGGKNLTGFTKKSRGNNSKTCIKIEVFIQHEVNDPKFGIKEILTPQVIQVQVNLGETETKTLVKIDDAVRHN